MEVSLLQKTPILTASILISRFSIFNILFQAVKQQSHGKDECHWEERKICLWENPTLSGSVW